jgi:hypothetical protein
MRFESMMAISALRMIGPRLAGLAALIGLWTGATGRVEAESITYMESTVASGTLGLQSFTDAVVTLTFVGDTTNVTNPSPGHYVNSVGTATVTVAGIGTATFTDQIQVFDNQMYAAGFTDVTINEDILDQAGGFQVTYDLKTAIGPVTGPLYPGTGPKFATNQGALVLTSASLTGTFTATTSAVPEPSSIVLASTAGLIGVVCSWRRRKAKLAA